MAKNDFDLDFDFEKEYGFDPKSILDSDYPEDGLDLTQFDLEQLRLDLESEDTDSDAFQDFDLDDPQPEDEELEPVPAAQEEKLFDDDEDDFGDEAYTEEEEELDQTRRMNFFGLHFPKQEAAAPVEEEADEEDEDYGEEEPDFEETPPELEEEPVYEEEPTAAEEFPVYEPEMQDDDDDEDDEEVQEQEEPAAQELADRPIRRRERTRKQQPAFDLPQIDLSKVNLPKIDFSKLTVPPIFLKLYQLYFPSMEEIDPKPEPGTRRRRKSKLQIFKEAYLPAIIACVSLVLIFSFMIGSLGNAIATKKEKDQAAALQAQKESQEADRIAAEAQSIIAEAKRMAAGYDYAGAIQLLEGFSGDIAKYPEMTNMKSEYMSAQTGLVEWKDLSTVPNLSFHVLIHDLTRALADDEYGGMYNRNFVTTEEFSKILDQLYNNGYVLVDMDCFVKSNVDSEGNSTYFVDSVFLPQGKKPVMLTETMVNYFAYMIDSDKNGVPDAGGAGFASRLVVDASGNIKAEYVDANGQTQVGNYDLVPILEDFIKAHPDFCYKDSRAILAVCGMEGIFGYRINNTYVATMGQSYVDDQIAQAKELVAALRAKGYTLACYTYNNKNYADINAQNIQADMASWASQITPVMGQVDTLVFARESDISDYTGPKFTTLYQSGIRYFIKNATEPYAEVNANYVRQSRLMVTGNTMAWKASMFTDDGLFDPVTVLNPLRGNVPN